MKFLHSTHSVRHAFLIGNQIFRAESGIQNLHGPANDLEAMTNVLSDPTKGQFHVTTHINRPRNEILLSLEHVLNSAERNDTVLIYYAGHGKLDQSGKLCLSTEETLSNALYSTSIPASHIADLVEQSRCENIIIILDCCYSGAFGKIFARGQADSQLNIISTASGVHIYTASTSTQAASELEFDVDGKIMGRFTHAIAEGIESGNADLDEDGVITLSDLRKYVGQKIKGQTPQYWAKRASGNDPIIALSSKKNIFVERSEVKHQILRKKYNSGIFSNHFSASKKFLTYAIFAFLFLLVINLYIQREEPYIPVNEKVVIPDLPESFSEPEPEPAPVPVQELPPLPPESSVGSYIELAGITFDQGQNYLDEKQIEQLDSISSSLKIHSSIHINIKSIALEKTSTQSKKMAELRGNMIRDYLVKKGINFKRISVISIPAKIDPSKSEDNSADEKLDRIIFEVI